MVEAVERERALGVPLDAHRGGGVAIARTRSWPGLGRPARAVIIHRNDGLIQVIRSRLNGATNVPAATAGAAIAGVYAW